MLLMLPGPTPIPPPVLTALSSPAVAHRDSAFEALLRGCCADLATVFRCAGPVVPITGSGTTAFEATQLSLAQPGDKVVACASGKFGARWAEVYRHAAGTRNLRVIEVQAPWGESITPGRVADALSAHPDATAVTVVHAETSTGTVSDLRTIAQTVRRCAPDALLLADCVASVAAIPVETDAWDIDAVVCGSQKGFMLPPGLGFVALSRRARERLAAQPCQAPMSMDLRAWAQAAETGRAPFTPPTGMFFALRAALDLLLAEGIEQIWRRCAAVARASRDTLGALGLQIASRAPCDAVTAAWLPEDDAGLLGRITEHQSVRFGRGQGPWSGRVLRLGHMGAITADNTARAFGALGAELAGAEASQAETHFRKAYADAEQPQPAQKDAER